MLLLLRYNLQIRQAFYRTLVLFSQNYDVVPGKSPELPDVGLFVYSPSALLPGEERTRSFPSTKPPILSANLANDGRDRPFRPTKPPTPS